MQIILPLIFLVGGTPLIASEIRDQGATEMVGMLTRDLKMCHQNEWRHLTVNLEYSADSNVDEKAVRTHVRQFLENYSEPDDFWEVMNTKLVASLRDMFPKIESLKSKLSLEPDKTLHFPRESLVEYRGGKITERFNFTKLKYRICQETFNALDFHVAWTMKEGAKEYPDYQWVDKAMEAFFKERPMSSSKWEDLKPKLESHLIQQFSAVESFQVEVKKGE